MSFLITLPFLFQGIAMLFDEFYFHHKRGLPKWERLGHPLDTLTVLACFSYLMFAREFNVAIYVALAAFSCLFITKDEFVHKDACDAKETWLHSVLFVLHPIVLYIAFVIHSFEMFKPVFIFQYALTVLMLVYQIAYWIFYYREVDASVDNSIYDTLGDRWYTAFDDPVALLRQESKVKVPWVLERIQKDFQNLNSVKLLDIGCGAGFLSNSLATHSLQVIGVDLSQESLNVAKKHDVTQSVRYIKADAYQLPFENHSFDVVTCMDFLEHVDEPEKVIQEVSRILKPGGLFFYHTFNRNLLSHLVIIKFVDWFVKNTPKNMHVIRLFIKPKELEGYCAQSGLKTIQMTGIRPIFSSIKVGSFLTGIVPESFSFTLTQSLALSYMGYTKKEASNG